MRSLFHYEGPIFGTLSKIGDLAILGLLVLLGSLPVVTVGTAITAGHFAALKLARGDSKLFSDFWSSYVSNLKQGCVIWVLFLGLWVACVFGMRHFSVGMPAVSVLLGIVLLLSLLVSLWVFPVLSKFILTTANTIRNALVLCFRHLFRSLAMLILFFLPPLAVVYIGLGVLPLWILFGLSLPIWIGAMLYNSIFAELEAEVRNNSQ